MSSLKQELRSVFESRSLFSRYEERGLLENGTLEKMINLSFFNLRRYCSCCRWRIIALRSPKPIQKLYQLSNHLQDITDAAVVLLVISCPSEGLPGQDFRSHTELLDLSIMYSAKFYGVDFCLLDPIDSGAINREFKIADGESIASVICLGSPGSFISLPQLKEKSYYTELVMEI